MFGTKSAATKTRNAREFVILLLLIALLAGGAVLLWQPLSVSIAGQPIDGTNKLSGKLWNQSLHPAGLGAPPREAPERFKLQGVIAERYEVLEDPANGELMMHDGNSGVGVNTTSIEGDRAMLAKDMLELEEYGEANRSKLSPDAYRWLKKVVQSGAELAYGTPGVPPQAQPAIKEKLLEQFHQISSQPADSILNSGKYMELESVFAKPELAYVSGDPASVFMRPDPWLAPTLQRLSPENISLLKDIQLLPSPSTLTLIEQPTLYNTITPTNILLVTETNTTLNSTVTKLSGNVTSGVTAATYYDVTLAPLKSSSPTTTTATSSPELTTSRADVSVTTVVNGTDVTDQTTTVVQQ